jgi:hypothetical protein
MFLKTIVRLRSMAVAGVAGIILSGAGCTERMEDSPDRHPGPPRDMPSTNVKEGAASGRGVSPATGPKMTFERPPLTNLNEIASNPDPTTLASQQVALTGAPVLHVLSSQYVVLGEREPGVVVRLKELQPGLKAGQRLNVTGMISQLGEDLAHWELDPDKKASVRKYSIFVNAIHSELSTP